MHRVCVVIWVIYVKIENLTAQSQGAGIGTTFLTSSSNCDEASVMNLRKSSPPDLTEMAEQSTSVFMISVAPLNNIRVVKDI